MRLYAPLCVVPALVLGVAPPLTGQHVEITEWPVPWENTRPRDPYVDVEGRVWFVGQRGDYLAYLEPGSGDFKRYELMPGAGPHNLIVDADGLVWYAGNRAEHIGRLNPATGDITRVPMPDPAAGDPHTLVFDHAGDIWFTVQRGNFVGKLTVATLEVQLIPVPTPAARPYGIVIDSQNRPWVALFGSNKIATVDPATMELREYELPRETTRPRRLVLTSDDIVWYVDFVGGRLGRLDPASGAVQEWMAPAGDRAGPYGLAVDGADRLWFVESTPKPNRFVGFETDRLDFTGITEIESGGGTVRHMFYHEATGTVWFGTDANTIGRARVSWSPEE
jgi:virginiamycin B lyase